MSLRNFCLILTLSAALVPAAMAQKKVIQTPNTAPNRPFSSALMVGNTLYVSGMVGRTPDGKIPDNFDDEVKQTLFLVRPRGRRMHPLVAELEARFA